VAELNFISFFIFHSVVALGPDWAWTFLTLRLVLYRTVSNIITIITILWVWRMIMQGDLERIGDKRMWPISKYYRTFRFVGLRETRSKTE